MTTPVRLQFEAIDRVTIDVSGKTVRLEGSGLSSGAYYQHLGVTFELSDETFRCLLLAENARRDGLLLAIQGVQEGSHLRAMPFADGPMMPACMPQPSPSPDPSPSPSPEPVGRHELYRCNDTISWWDYPLLQLDECSSAPKPVVMD